MVVGGNSSLNKPHKIIITHGLIDTKCMPTLNIGYRKSNLTENIDIVGL